MANLRLNRQQLAQFLPNHEAIKAFEALFDNVQDAIPSSLDDVQATADNAQLQAAEALSGLAQIANALSLALYGAYSEQISSDNHTQPNEQAQQDNYNPPISLGSMAEQNADKVNIKGGSIANVLFSGTNIVAPETHTATSKATPVDADELPISDSAFSFGLKKLTWANLKATLASWINGNSIAASFTNVTSNGPVAINGNAIGSNAYQLFMLNGVNAAILGSDASIFGGSANDFGMYLYGAASEFAIAPSGTKRLRVNNSGITVAGVASVVGGAAFIQTTSPLTNGAGVGAGTLLTAPVGGNPTKWIGINDNGTIRYIPSW